MTQEDKDNKEERMNSEMKTLYIIHLFLFNIITC